MLDLLARRAPSPATDPDRSRPAVRPHPATAARSRAEGWASTLADHLRLAARSIRRPGCLAELAELAATAREPDEVRMALVRLAAEFSGATKVELVRDRDGHASRRLAIWPPPQATPVVESGSGPRGPIAAAVVAVAGRRPAPAVLQVALKAGEANYGTLRLTAPGPRPWSAPVVRRLETLCGLAAVAERGLGPAPRAEADSDSLLDPEIGPRGSTMLAAFLGFAQAQARRRVEPLALLDVAVDRLGALRELLGDELADAAIARTARAIKATVRASDVIVRLEDGRLAVILPNASAENAAKVAEAVRAAIARAGSASASMPTLTASVGLACYPDHAHDVPALRAAASAALTRARAMGYDRVAHPASRDRRAHARRDQPDAEAEAGSRGPEGAGRSRQQGAGRGVHLRPRVH